MTLLDTLRAIGKAAKVSRPENETKIWNLRGRTPRMTGADEFRAWHQYHNWRDGLPVNWAVVDELLGRYS